MASNVISGKDFLDALARSIGIEESKLIQRIVLDVPFDGVVQVYVEMIGTKKLVEIKLPDLSGAKVTILE